MSLLLLAVIEALLVHRALRWARGLSGVVPLGADSFTTGRSPLPAKLWSWWSWVPPKLLPTSFTHSPHVTWLVKTEFKAVSASAVVIPTNSMWFPPYPATPCSKWTSLSLGHLPLSSLGADSIPIKFPSLKMNTDNRLVQKHETLFETQINFTLWSVA